MTFEFKCEECKKLFEVSISVEIAKLYPGYPECPECGGRTKKQFHACTNIYVPSYFHTSRSDIFDDKEWQDLKKNPDIERAK